MYHIKNDKRQKESALRLMKGLTECLRLKPMSEIGISDLCVASNVSRSTFYRMFDTPTDLLEYTSDKYIEKAIADYSREVFRNEEDFILYSLMYWKNHTDLLEAAINSGRIDIIKKSFMAHSEILVPMMVNEFKEDELDYLMAGLSGLVTSMLTLWIERGKKETPVQLFELYRKISEMRYLGHTSINSR